MQPHGHSAADARNLYLHRAAMAKLAANPGMRKTCLSLIDRWLEDKQHASRPWLEQWRDMLTNWSHDEIEVLILDELKGQTLRQCSPLGPLLTPKERWALLEEVNRGLRASRVAGT